MATITGTDGTDKLTGTAGNDIIDGLKDKDAMYGGKGSDIYIVDNDADQIFENAGEGTDLVKSTVTYTLSANVENGTLLGIANVSLTGNELANILTGNDGNNVLNGWSGKDTMNGGKGDDIYIVDNAGDKVVESLAGMAGGNDKVVASVDYSLAAVANVEVLELADSALKGTGNALANVLIGNAGDNVLDGGKGADTMTGGLGSDTYYVDNLGDVVTEKSGEGADTIISTIALAGPVAGVENYTFNTAAAVTFSGTTDDNLIKGGSGADKLDGGAGGNDSLFGNGGNDQLTTGDGVDFLDGGTGADVMQGGASDDAYVVDNVKDLVIEDKDAGNDGVYAKISIAKLFDNVEQLMLADGKSNINGTGNALDNTITGNDGNNVLDGGLGQDKMYGGNGNDTYIVDNSGDKVVEATPGSAGGTDLVKSSVSFWLDENVENLTLTGSGNNYGYGNAAKNVLTGNAGNNILDGKGGDDTMTGGAGHDVYYVDSLGDKVVEAANGGVDHIYSSIDYSIAALANIENLHLTGTAAVHAIGNAGNNMIYGNSIDNDIDGGKGADYMSGGKGDDTYHVDNLLDEVDELTGANYGNDTIISTVALTHSVLNVENYKFLTGQALSFEADASDNSIWGGSGNDTITGGGGHDSLYGGAGNDHLIGGADSDWLDGGKGADYMEGLGGDDIYIVDNVKDIVMEFFKSGTDEIDSSVSIDLLATNVENLVLLGTANLHGVGNDDANMIFGNSGNNFLNGNAGNDTLIGNGGDDEMHGGTGADTFVFNVAAAGQGHDKVTDFLKAEDVLQFYGVADGNNDGKIDLADLYATVTGVVDHGAGQAVDVAFANGAQVSFAGVGTGAVNSLDDLVSNAATQIHVN